MNKIKFLGKKSRALKDWLKKYWGILVLVLLTFFLLTYAWPESSAIYFDGTADQAVFTFRSDGDVTYGVKSDDKYNGTVVFRADPAEEIYAVRTSLSEEEIQRISEEGIPDWEPNGEKFAFNDGIATLSSFSSDLIKPFMTIVLKPPEGGSFTYDMEVSWDEEKKHGECSRIELKNFSEGTVIELNSTCDISMKGAPPEEVMPVMPYRIIGCTSVTIYSVPAIPEDPDLGYDPRLKGTLKSFEFINTEKDTFEITYQAETNFIEIGHVKMKGWADGEQELTLEISDIGQYPLPVKLYGEAGTLTMGGSSCYPTPGQWLLEKRSELLLSIAGLFIGLMFKKAEEKKPEEDNPKEKKPEEEKPKPEDPDPENLEKENLEPDNPVEESES